jgi:hypothetical protein
MSNRLAMCGAWCVLGTVLGLAMAADACGGEAWGYGSGYYPYYPYYAPIPLRADQSIPYYAVHPPVYYSHIVPRPYGYSPYAYVPGIVTPGFELGGPRLRCAPGYVRPGARGPKSYAPPPQADPAQKGANANRQAAFKAPSPRPLVIENAYCSDDSAPGPTKRASTTPQRITNPYCTGLAYLESGVSEATGGD